MAVTIQGSAPSPAQKLAFQQAFNVPDATAVAIDVAAAQAAKTQAESARDAALIQAGVYVDEPTGRAAVADGVAFKVQGTGDVAAYEYRRTNSGASVLIAMYPDARSPYIGKPLPSESGYVWALVDSSDHLAIGVRPDGSVEGNFVTPPLAGAQYLQPSKNLYFIGDSLTAGAYSQVTWREALPALISTRAFTSQAVGGETSTQQAAKFGAYVSLLTLTGNQIPASGGVAVTARTVNVLSAQGMQSIAGTLGGVPGTLSRNGSDVYTFTRTTAGSAINVGVKMPFVPDVGGHDFDTLMIFVGQNNPDSVEDVKRDIAMMIAMQKTAEKRFFILTPHSAGGVISPGNPTDVGTGSARLANVKLIEDWAVQTYGDRVLKVREFSFQFNNGSADDLDDVAREVVPRSLRMDSTHFTTAFFAQIAAYVASQINQRGW